jgi:hypothetical protein
MAGYRPTQSVAAAPASVMVYDDVSKKRILIYVLFFCCSDKRPEQSIAAARASVMVYDDVNKKWVPAGTSHGLSKVRFFIFETETMKKCTVFTH